MFDNTNFPWVENMPFDIPTIGHMMRAAGYYSTYQGKWHLHRIAAEPDHKIYTERWPLSLAPSRKEPWNTPGRPGAHLDYQKAQALLTGRIPNRDGRWRKLQDYYLNCISEMGRDDGSHLPDIDGVNWAIERFDP